MSLFNKCMAHSGFNIVGVHHTIHHLSDSGETILTLSIVKGLPFCALANIVLVCYTNLMQINRISILAKYTNLSTASVYVCSNCILASLILCNS